MQHSCLHCLCESPSPARSDGITLAQTPSSSLLASRSGTGRTEPRSPIPAFDNPALRHLREASHLQTVRIAAAGRCPTTEPPRSVERLRQPAPAARYPPNASRQPRAGARSVELLGLSLEGQRDLQASVSVLRPSCRSSGHFLGPNQPQQSRGRQSDLPAIHHVIRETRSGTLSGKTRAPL